MSDWGDANKKARHRSSELLAILLVIPNPFQSVLVGFGRFWLFLVITGYNQSDLVGSSRI